MDFGERLISLREKNGIERKELSEIMEIPYTTLRNYEIGTREPGHLFLIKLTKIFNVTVDYLLGLDDEKETYEKQLVEHSPFSPSTNEVATAYENADFDIKNNIRFMLKLPLLKEELELKKNMKTS
ncbi:MAG: helix-turn-helix transcriptional regulator [Anaerotignum sp.]|nr:helix-turn-helix transcriptional regulator [Anaerotignum sp.]